MLMKLRLLKIFRAIRALKIKQKTISNSDQRICFSSKIPLLLGLKSGTSVYAIGLEVWLLVILIGQAATVHTADLGYKIILLQPQLKLKIFS